jgi:hypothetical protein
MKRRGRAVGRALHSVDAMQRSGANLSLPLQRFRMLTRLMKRT